MSRMNRQGHQQQQQGNLYQQLIDNDLVRELDDIEAISQQISQHAEVLYQSWKNNASPNSPTPSGEFRTLPGPSRPGLSRSTSNPYSSYNGGGSSADLDSASNESHHSLEAASTSSLSDTASSSMNSGRGSGRPFGGDSAASTFPSRRSVTQIRPSEPLELLSSSEMNGNLKDLVNSFVSTDRAKQAARQTISDTISNMTRRDPKMSSPSPLKSPLLAAASSPSSTMSSPSSSLMSHRQSPANPFTFPSVSEFPDVHSKMTPIFRSNNVDRTDIPIRSTPSWSGNNGIHTITPSSSSNEVTMRTRSSTSSSYGGNSIPIPVQHLGRSSSSPISSSQSDSSGLKSPTVLQTINTTAPSFPRRSSNRNSLEFDMPLPHLHAANVEKMRQRFEEAKQRINTMHRRAMDNFGLFGRAGGPGSGFSGVRSLFEHDNVDLIDGMPRLIGEDGEALLNRRIRRRETPQAPHPELTPQQKQHIIERTSGVSSSTAPGSSVNSLNYNSHGFPMRRFLSGNGSVAERVMIFERCPPEVKESVSPPSSSITPPALTPPVTTTSMSSHPVPRLEDHDFRRKKLSSDLSITQPSLKSSTLLSSKPSMVATKVLKESPVMSVVDSGGPSAFGSAKPQSKPVQQSTTYTTRVSPFSLSPKTIGRKKETYLPKFYFPQGNPLQSSINVDRVIQQIKQQFKQFNKMAISVEDLGQLLKNCGYPPTWRSIILNAATADKSGRSGGVTLDQLTSLWVKMCKNNHDEASHFVYLLTNGRRKYLFPEDFVLLIQDIVDSHPGLGFLKEATEFHSRYVHTVIARIFFAVNRSWSGSISISELRKSNFLDVLRILDEEEDINRITDFFSYEHFYVIYCKFWELDKDHDLFIDREDLSKHNDHAISTRMIDRIFSGAVTRGSAQQAGKMSYTEFVWFLLAEEDKRHPTSIEYWFRCMDLDGDGYLSMYELEYFYEEQLQRMEQLGIETLPFEDCLCQMLDMIMPKERNKVALSDLKRCSMTPIFFDTFFNLEKYLDHEQRDPFASQREIDEDGNELSDWDRFAAEEYELLVAEEGNNEDLQDGDYESCADGNLQQIDETSHNHDDLLLNSTKTN